jgi:hypothetical protein
MKARLLAGLLVLLLAPAAALADGDPASDVLLSQDVFFPYTQISPQLERQLYATSAQARRAGYPIKVALIASPSDLGVVPALFGKPRAYARFLSAELAGVVRTPVLVVMPAGLGLAAQGQGRSQAGLAQIKPSGSSADALATAAMSAVPRLAAAAGRPLPASSASSGGPASSATVRRALIEMLGIALLAGAGVAFAFRARSRKRVTSS